MDLTIRYIPWYLSWKGLLGTKKPEIILLKTHFGIHTFGMNYPIDVVILDKKGVVQSVKEHLKPNRIFLWGSWHNSVLELPDGTIRQKNIRPGISISLQIQ